MAKRGSCEYYKDFFNKRNYEDKTFTSSGIQKSGNGSVILSLGEHMTIAGFQHLAHQERRKAGYNNTPQINVDDCLPENRCILTFMFDNKNKGIGEVGFYDYLKQVTPVISFKSYEEICNNICKSTHLLISEGIETSNKDDETSINGKNNYSIIYSDITSNKKSPPYHIGKTVFTIDEYTKFVDENKNENPTELPRLNLFVNIDNFVKTELSYTEWLKTQLKTSPKTDVLPTVELPKTDESPKTDQLSTGDDDKDGPPPGYDEYDRDPPPGYYDQNYTTGPTGGARSRRCRKDRKNKSRRCRKSKRRNNKKRRRNTRR
jgi:hypothetical protein